MERELGVLKASYLHIAALVGGETKVYKLLKTFHKGIRNYNELSLSNVQVEKEKVCQEQTQVK